MHPTRRRSAVALIATFALALTFAVDRPAEARSTVATSSYIVQVDPALGAAASVVNAAVAPLGGHVDQVFTKAINGAVVTLPVPALGALIHAPGVVSVDPNGVMSIDGNQTGVPWGIDRIDQRNLPLDNSYTWGPGDGHGVTAYVIDTGIRTTHSEFEGRATSGFDAIDALPADDCNGHGTHVSGTIGGKTYGVAKQVHLVAVRVLDCNGSGTNAQVIAGIDYVIGNHAAGAPAVANMSLGGSANSAIDTAINNLVNDGVTVAVAAGNDTADACSTSPARVPNAITVAATDKTDAMASFSNGGTCVDLFGPGVDVLSSWNTNDTATNTISGTSMATPHVAGVAARYLSANTASSPAAVASALASKATTGKVTGTAKQCTLLFIGCRPATPNPKLLYLSPSE